MTYRNFSYVLIIVISSAFSVHRSWTMEEKEETEKFSTEHAKNTFDAFFKKHCNINTVFDNFSDVQAYADLLYSWYLAQRKNSYSQEIQNDFYTYSKNLASKISSLIIAQSLPQLVQSTTRYAFARYFSKKLYDLDSPELFIINPTTAISTQESVSETLCIFLQNYFNFQKPLKEHPFAELYVTLGKDAFDFYQKNHNQKTFNSIKTKITNCASKPYPTEKFKQDILCLPSEIRGNLGINIANDNPKDHYQCQQQNMARFIYNNSLSSLAELTKAEHKKRLAHIFASHNKMKKTFFCTIGVVCALSVIMYKRPDYFVSTVRKLALVVPPLLVGSYYGYTEYKNKQKYTALLQNLPNPLSLSDISERVYTDFPVQYDSQT
jgi:hypothetical protein